MKSEVKQVLSVMFIGEWYASKPISVINAINNKIDVFDGEPIILPIAKDNLSSKVPRIILSDEADSVGLQLGFEQAALMVRGDRENKLALAAGLLSDLAEVLIDELGWTINRLGRVATFELELEDDTSKFLKSKYLAIDDEFTRAQINLLADRQEKYNRWLRMDTLEDDKVNNILEAKVDINLKPDEDRTLDSKDVRQFNEESNALIMDEIRRVLS